MGSFLTSISRVIVPMIARKSNSFLNKPSNINSETKPLTTSLENSINHESKTQSKISNDVFNKSKNDNKQPHWSDDPKLVMDLFSSHSS